MIKCSWEMGDPKHDCLDIDEMEDRVYTKIVYHACTGFVNGTF